MVFFNVILITEFHIFFSLLSSFLSCHQPISWTCTHSTCTVYSLVCKMMQRPKLPLKQWLLSEGCPTSFNDLFLCSSTVSERRPSTKESWASLCYRFACILSEKKHTCTCITHWSFLLHTFTVTITKACH